MPAPTSSAPAAPASASRRTCRCCRPAAAGARRRPVPRHAHAAQHHRARDEGARHAAGHARTCRRRRPARSRARRSPCRRRTWSSPPARRRSCVWPVSVPAEAFSIAWEAAAEETAAAARSDRAEGDAARRRRGAGARAAGDAGAARRPLHAAGRARRPMRCRGSGGKRGGLQRRGAAAADRRAARPAPLLRDLPVHLPRAEDLARRSACSDARCGRASPTQLPTYLDSDGLASYFPPRADDAAARQRPPHRLRARGHARGRLRAAARPARERRCSTA